MQKKNWKGGRLVSSGIVCYAEKKEQHFWFSSLCEMVQFATIIFYKNYFGQFVWIEKECHYYSGVSLHEAPTKNALTTLVGTA